VQNVNEDKKLKSAIKKFGVQPLQDIEEVNMFKDDNTVVHFKRPLSKFL
jgi:nascent polypeptide-associated complex subunit beta